MAQTTVTNEPLRAFEGKLQDRAERSVSGIASELIYFGKALSRLPASGVGDIPPKVNLYNLGEVFEGVAVADMSVQRLADPTTGALNQAPYGAYLADTGVQVLRKGRIWVVSADAIDNLTKSVFVRSALATGTAATITDTTTYAVADQDGLTSVITITDGGVGSAAGPQTVTFAGATTTAAQVAAQMNAQLVGCRVEVSGGQVLITTDAVGAGVTIAAAAGTGNLTWAAPVAGAGDSTTMPQAAQGSFRATAATDYTDLGAVAPVVWKAAQTINGVNFGLLEVNMP
jgi:hypothetical protein